MDILKEEHSLFDEILILSTLIIIFVLFDDAGIKIIIGFTLFLIIIRHYFRKNIFISLIDTTFILFYSTLNIFITFLFFNLFKENFWFNLYYWFIPFLSALYIILRSILMKITSFSNFLVFSAFAISSIAPLYLTYFNLILIYELPEKYLTNDSALSKVEIEEIHFVFSFLLMLIPFFYSLFLIFKNKVFSNLNISSLLILYLNQIVISIGMSIIIFWLLDGFS